jgi:hypothetical protein
MRYSDIINEGIIPFVRLEDINQNINFDTLVGKTLSLSDWTKAISRRIRIPEIKVDMLLTDKIDSGEMTIHAEYDVDTHQKGKKYIFVTLVFSAKDTELTLYKEGLDYLKFKIAPAVQHELQHSKQYSGRDFVSTRKFSKFTTDEPQIKTAQKYLGSDDEIDAYSVNIAHQLVDYFGKEQALIAIRNPSKISREISMDLFVYSISFGMDWATPVLKKLLKKIVLYINEI